MPSVRYTLPIGVPFKWEICAQCQGDGGSSAYLGAFTQDVWAEQDDEFKEDYIAGRYDRPCPACNGSGKVQVPDITKCSYQDKRQLVELRRQFRADAEIDAIQRAEQRAEAYACGERN